MNRLRHYPGYLAYRIFSGLFGLLPEPAMRKTGEALGVVAFYLAPGRRRIAEANMRRVVGSDGPLRRLTRQLFASYGRYWAETFWVRPRRLDEMMSHTSVEGMEHIRELRKHGGVILALPHLGNWEAAGLQGVAESLDLVAAAEALPNPLISRWFIDQRALFGIDVVLVEKGASTRLLSLLQSGRTLALPSDRDLSGRGVAVKFFEEETTFPAGPFVLSKRTGARVVPVATYFRETGRGHEFVVRPPLREGTIEDMAQELAGHFEDFIRARPTQWHVLQPLWPSDRTDRS